MTALPFEKTVAEAFPIGFQFYGKLPPGARIVSATATAHNVTDDVDAPDVLQSGTGVVAGTLVKVGVTGGVAGKTYLITARVVLSTDPDDNLEESREMTVTA